MTGEKEIVYYLFGNPVQHSLSPVMHRAAFQAMKLDACYHACRVKELSSAVAAMRALGIRGASITIPFKEAILPLLDDIDEEVRRIGAVNTVINHDGRLEGANTDGHGFIATFLEKADLTGKRVLVLGAGGTARSVVFQLMKNGAEVWITNRTRERAERLARSLGCAVIPWEQSAETRATVLVNTTPVGMYPCTDESPWPRDGLDAFEIVADVIYNPRETRLLARARQAGCQIVTGVDMFVHQGAEQIRLWTGLEPPIDIMREAVEAALSGHETRN